MGMKFTWFHHTDCSTEQADELLAQYQRRGVRVERSLNPDYITWTISVRLPESKIHRAPIVDGGTGCGGNSEYIPKLAQYALTKCDRVAALRKLDAGVKPRVMRQLATFAFEDYSRSAASMKQCECCNGEGFIDADVFTMKSHYTMKLPQWAKDLKQSPSDFEVKRQVKEGARVICSACNGKKVISCACGDCRGRGKAVNIVLTEKQGVPVLADCKRCSGRGYERIPST